MSSIADQESLTSDAVRSVRASLRVPAYDKVASLLIALLILVGVGVLFLFVTWLSNRVIIREMAIPVIVEEMGGGVETGFGTEGMEIEAPQVSEVAQTGGKTEPKFADMVEDVVAASASPLGDAGELDLLEVEQTPRGGSSKGTGNQPARGTGGGAGGGSGSGVGTSRGQRWEIQFRDTDSLDAYARQLDFFGIELGVMGNTNQVVYVRNLAQPKPDQRTDRRDEERRLYMSWRRGALQQADRDLVQRAGVSPTGKVVLQFFPADLENRLAFMELQYQGRKAKDIRRTRFGVKVAGKGFEFYVMEQTTF